MTKSNDEKYDKKKEVRMTKKNYENDKKICRSKQRETVDFST
jgi:hypothetical protein